MNLYDRTDLNYTVINEVIINGYDLLLISEDVESMGCTVYQVVYKSGIELTTVEYEQAIKLFKKCYKELTKKIVL